MSAAEVLVGNAALALGLALVATAAGRLCRRPAVVHALWLLVLAKLVTPPLYRLPILPVAPAAPATSTEALPAPSDPVEPERGLEPQALPPPGAAPLDLATALALVWGAGSLALLLLTLSRAVRFGRRVRASSRAPERIRREAEEWGRRLGLRAVPDVRWTEARIAPLVWAFLGPPVVMLPARLLSRLDGEQRAALLIHELAHVRRRDHVVRYVESAVLVLFWWNPIAWWARSALRRAEEECCDAWVVWALPGGTRAYATAIVDTLDYLFETGVGLPALSSGLRPVDSLRRRLTMIMQGRQQRSMSSLSRLALLLGAALWLPALASHAQEATTPAPAPAPAVEPPAAIATTSPAAPVAIRRSLARTAPAAKRTARAAVSPAPAAEPGSEGACTTAPEPVGPAGMGGGAAIAGSLAPGGARGGEAYGVGPGLAPGGAGGGTAGYAPGMGGAFGGGVGGGPGGGAGFGGSTVTPPAPAPQQRRKGGKTTTHRHAPGDPFVAPEGAPAPIYPHSDPQPVPQARRPSTLLAPRSPRPGGAVPGETTLAPAPPPTTLDSRSAPRFRGPAGGGGGASGSQDDRIRALEEEFKRLSERMDEIRGEIQQLRGAGASEPIRMVAR